VSEFVRAIKAGDVPEGEGRTVEVSGRRVAVFNAGGAFYAIDDECPHQGGPLGEGCLSGAYVTCPWHAWDFNVMTGELDGDPETRIETFEVKVEGDDVLINV